MPRYARPDWIDWRKSDARQVLLDDLASGRLPLDNDVVTAEEAWEEMYFPLPEFSDVVFSQFKARLKDHRKQVARRHGASAFFLNAFRHDQQLRVQGHLPGGGFHNRQGQRIFERSPAAPLLREDVIDEKHKAMTTDDLRATRDEFLEWPIEVFRRRLRQEIGTQKWHYYLEWKRAKKQLKRGQKSQDTGQDSEEEDNNADEDDNAEEEDGMEVEEHAEEEVHMVH